MALRSRQFTKSLLNGSSSISMAKHNPMVTMSKSMGASNRVSASKVHTTSPLAPQDEFQLSKHAKQNVSMNAIPQNRSIPPPVMEGFDNVPSAHVAPIGSGYDNRNLKRVRQMGNHHSPNPIPNGFQTRPLDTFRKSGVHDYRYGSSSRLNKLF